MNEFF